MLQKLFKFFKKSYLETLIFLELSLEDNLYIGPPLDDLDRHHWNGRLVRRHANEDRDRQIWNGKTFCEIHLKLQTPVDISLNYCFKNIVKFSNKQWPVQHAGAAAAESFHNQIEKSQSGLTRLFY